MWPFGRAKPKRGYVVLPLDDPKLEEHARRLAEFVRQHTGAGHELHLARRSGRDQTIACVCGGLQRSGTGAMPTVLMEDEIIDDG